MRVALTARQGHFPPEAQKSACAQQPHSHFPSPPGSSRPALQCVQLRGYARGAGGGNKEQMGSSPARCLAQSACSPSAGPLRWSWPRRERRALSLGSLRSPSQKLRGRHKARGRGVWPMRPGLFVQARWPFLDGPRGFWKPFLEARGLPRER